MTIMQFDRRISLGNVLGLVPLIIALIMWAVQVNGDGAIAREAADRAADNARAVTQQQHTIAGHAARLAALERMADQRQADIVRRLERIEDKLDKVPLR